MSHFQIPRCLFTQAAAHGVSGEAATLVRLNAQAAAAAAEVAAEAAAKIAATKAWHTPHDAPT